MKKLLIIVFLVAGCQDAVKEKVDVLDSRYPIYIYDSDSFFTMFKASHNSARHYQKTLPLYCRMPKEEGSRKWILADGGVETFYFFPRDSAVKSISYLDSIDYIEANYLKEEANLIHLWQLGGTQHGFRRFPSSSLDTFRIYMITPVQGVDSILIERVVRRYNFPDVLIGLPVRYFREKYPNYNIEDLIEAGKDYW